MNSIRIKQIDASELPAIQKVAWHALVCSLIGVSLGLAGCTSESDAAKQTWCTATRELLVAMTAAAYDTSEDPKLIELAQERAEYVGSLEVPAWIDETSEKLKNVPASAVPDAIRYTMARKCAQRLEPAQWCASVRLSNSIEEKYGFNEDYPSIPAGEALTIVEQYYDAVWVMPDNEEVVDAFVTEALNRTDVFMPLPSDTPENLERRDAARTEAAAIIDAFKAEHGCSHVTTDLESPATIDRPEGLLSTQLVHIR